MEMSYGHGGWKTLQGLLLCIKLLFFFFLLCLHMEKECTISLGSLFKDTKIISEASVNHLWKPRLLVASSWGLGFYSLFPQRLSSEGEPSRAPSPSTVLSSGVTRSAADLCPDLPLPAAFLHPLACASLPPGLPPKETPTVSPSLTTMY